MRIIKSIILSLSLLFMMLSLSECRKDSLMKDSFSFAFSDDTLLFDTVFTHLAPSANPPSIYQVLVVKNTLKKKIKTNILLAGGSSSVFRMNVDGLKGTDIRDFEVNAGDSFYIFVEAYLNQNNASNPLVISDSIIFENNGNLQNIKLVAWGQDAHYLADTVIEKNTTLINDGKPYVFYNFVGVDYNTKLTIDPGVHVYCHNNVRIYIGGTLEVKGDTNNRVIFEGDRLQNSYSEVPNQWVGIRFLPQSKNNLIKNCLIKNAIVGIEVDSTPMVSGTFNLQLEQVEIRNMGQVGVVGYSASIKATNCLIYNCGKYTFAGIYGGTYDIKHTTLANYNGKYVNRKDSHFGFNNQVPVDNNGAPILVVPLTYILQNNIIYGDQEEELEISLDANNPFPTSELVEKNILKTTKLFDRYKDKNLVNEDPKFIKVEDMNYTLDLSSKAIDYGNLLNVGFDLRGALRNNTPDIGCYEMK